MSLPVDHFRRTLMTALATLRLTGVAATSSSGGEQRRAGSRTLVAYFSCSGTTRVVAGLIRRSLNTDLPEIRPATPYPEDCLATVEQARQERDVAVSARCRPRSPTWETTTRCFRDSPSGEKPRHRSSAPLFRHTLCPAGHRSHSSLTGATASRVVSRYTPAMLRTQSCAVRSS